MGIWTLAILVLATSRLTAADEKKVETGSVEGKVTYQGKPLPGAIIGFHPAKGKPVVAKTDETGSYSAPAVPVGEVRVTIEVVRPKPPKDKPTDKPVTPPRFIAIPKKYANPETSGLTLTVQKGKQVHDIELR